MRKANGWWRWVLVLGSMGFVCSSLDSCVADVLRDAADELNDAAYGVDGKPQDLDQWWDSVWDSDSNDDEDLGDWWDDLWD